MKIRPILMMGWLLGLAAVTGQEAKLNPAPTTKSEPVMAPEDTDLSRGVSEDDPFASNSGQAPRTRIPLDRGKEFRTVLQLRFEAWELETKKLAAGLDAVHGPDELEVLRKGLLADPAASLLHSLVSSTDEKSRTADESILEFIYPTEYEPPVGPPGKAEPAEASKENAAWQRWLDAAGKYSVPTSFETRNTGATLEAAIQPVQGEGEKRGM